MNPSDLEQDVGPVNNITMQSASESNPESEELSQLVSTVDRRMVAFEHSRTSGYSTYLRLTP